MSNKKWEDFSEEEILEANIAKYEQDAIVQFYEDFDEPRYSYIEYEVIFTSVLETMRKKLGRPVRAVDMCGGAGKGAFTLKACQPDCQVTLVDLSEKMLEVARRKAVKNSLHDIDIVQADAFSFLAQENEYDLFVYSSALHHFKDPITLLQQTAEKLSPQGMIISIADPNTLTKSRRYAFLQFSASNWEIKKQVMKNKFDRLLGADTKQNSNLPDFDVAEYLTFTGIDDIAFTRQVQNIGLQPLIHMRYPAGEPYMTRILPYIGLYWAFSTVLHKDTEPGYQIYKEQMKREIATNLPFRIKYY